ncbi:MAG: hypothetical protein PF694_04210 [Bacteroidetes bacterium]|jgi:uncharacterized lipoprotein NlpE involved in copper resistance|nr:hypothetical protein [Bacteroidota bacterium]
MKTSNIILIFCVFIFSLSCINTNSEQDSFNDFEFDSIGMLFEGKYIFSETESMSTAVFILPDSLFFILKKINDDTIWNASTGIWRRSNGQLLFDGGNQSRLVAKAVKQGLEVLNNAGEAVMKAEKFILEPKSIDSIKTYQFKLTGAYSYFADAALIRFCNTPKAIQVLPLKANIDAERAYLNADSTAEIGLFLAATARLNHTHQTESSFKFALELEEIHQFLPLLECY